MNKELGSDSERISVEDNIELSYSSGLITEPGQ